jgi:hypothetical protein
MGVSKEAETMCKRMDENNMLLDVFDDDLSERSRTLYLMIDTLKKSSAPAGNKIDEEEFVSRNDPSGDGNGIAADEAAATHGTDVPYAFLLPLMHLYMV